jgi:hypothetical protein
MGLRMNLDIRSQTQAWLGLAEREVFSYLRAFSHTARTGIDIGAADGEYTLFLCRNRTSSRCSPSIPPNAFQQILLLIWP